MIIVRSHIGYARRKASTPPKSHGSPLGEDEVRATKKAIGWDPDKHFFVPDEVYEHMNGDRARQRARGRVAAAVRDVVAGVPGGAREVGRRVGGTIGPWTPPEFEAGEEIATRDAGKKVMQAFKDAVPTMIGGAADLVESTKTEFDGGGSSRAAAGRAATSPFGIREHAMGSIVNGIGVHGGCVEAVRLDVPDLQRLHAARRCASRR